MNELILLVLTVHSVVAIFWKIQGYMISSFKVMDKRSAHLEHFLLSFWEMCEFTIIIRFPCINQEIIMEQSWNLSWELPRMLETRPCRNKNFHMSNYVENSHNLTNSFKSFGILSGQFCLWPQLYKNLDKWMS